MENSPLNFINAWDFVLLFVGVALRFLGTIKSKSSLVEDFSIVKYFDSKHVIRWVFHVAVSLAALLVLPQLFVGYIQPKYANDLEFWALAGSLTIGFIGYDLIRYVEKISFFFMKKIGIQTP